MTDEELLKQMTDNPGFFKHNNFEVVEASKESAVIKVNLTENSMNPYNIVHGGVIFGLGDTVMGMLVRAYGRPAVTLDANIAYLKPGSGSYLIAKAEMIKSGKKTSYLRANIYNEEETLIATMQANYFYLD